MKRTRLSVESIFLPPKSSYLFTPAATSAKGSLDSVRRWNSEQWQPLGRLELVDAFPIGVLIGFPLAVDLVADVDSGDHVADDRGK